MEEDKEVRVKETTSDYEEEEEEEQLSDVEVKRSYCLYTTPSLLFNGSASFLT